MRVCGACRGDGTYTRSHGDGEREIHDCLTCDQTGLLPVKHCRDCDEATVHDHVGVCLECVRNQP